MGPPTERRRPVALPDEVQRQVRRLLRQEVPSPDSVIRAAHTIYQWYMPSRSGEEAIAKWTELMEGLQRLRTERVIALRRGGMIDEPFDRVWGILTLTLTQLIASDMPLGKEGAAAIHRKRAELFDQARRGRMVSDAMIVASRQLDVDLKVRTRAVKLLRAYLHEDDLPPLQEWGTTSEDEINEVAASLNELRAYGVKPCVIEDGILHPLGFAWVFSDGYEVMSGLIQGYEAGFNIPLAITHLAPVKSIKRVRPRVNEGEGNDYVAALSLGFTPYMASMIRADGSNTTDMAHGVVSLEKIFCEADAQEIYPLFRLTHLLRLYDLIVPLEVMREEGVPEWPRPPVGSVGRKAYKRALPGVWRKLVVPRLRLLGKPRLIRKALERELAEAQELTVQLTKKQKRDIVGFLRPLPAGYKASPQARRQALEEHGIANIPDGYTYVRDHQRRSGTHKVTGHVAHRRSEL